MRRSVVVSFILILTGVVLVACGSSAEELRPTFAPTSTFNFEARIAIQQTRDAARANNQDEVVAVAQDTNAESTAPASAPTATPLPATATSIPSTALPEPTEVATEPVADAAVDVHERFPDLPADADPAIGELLFNGVPAPDTGQMCVTCHNVAEPLPGTGPYLYGVANRAGERVAGQTAVEYLYNSIVNPNDYIVPPQGDTVYSSGVMPQTWDDVLTEADIYSIVAYLLTLDQTE